MGCWDWGGGGVLVVGCRKDLNWLQNGRKKAQKAKKSKKIISRKVAKPQRKKG
jgi:hypothetical protein